MIAYRAVVLCNGCGLPTRDMGNTAEIADLPAVVDDLEYTARLTGWVKDGAAHFCPACQVQRGKAA